jgi:hypothetical protein
MGRILFGWLVTSVFAWVVAVCLFSALRMVAAQIERFGQ